MGKESGKVVMAEKGKTRRRFPCWIDAFTEAASDIGIPPPYVEWVAIYAVATAMGRHVWSMNYRGTTFPNLYVMMVGPPGTGKSEAEDLIRPFVQDLGVHLSAQHVSKAALIDELKEGHVRKLISKQQMEDYHHVAVLSAEFVETFPGYDAHFLGMLSNWWDCPKMVREKKRHLREAINIPKVCCNIMTGVQPGMLSHSFPTEAWQGGFLARTVFVYVPQKIELLLRTRKGEDRAVAGRRMDRQTQSALMKDLQAIGEMYGEMEEDEGFVDEYLKWRDNEQEPRPKHPRLIHYNGRREHQLEKLSMISAASRGSMVREAQDYKRARSWLESTEQNIEEIFVEMGQGDDMELMKDMHAFIVQRAQGCNRDVRETVVRRYLAGKIPSQRQDIFLETAERAGFIKIKAMQNGFRTICAIPMEEIQDEF